MSACHLLKLGRASKTSPLHFDDGRPIQLLIQLGDTFEVSTTVEGVETKGQVEFVRALGASEAQGFLISGPVSAEDAIAILRCEPAKVAARSIG